MGNSFTTGHKRIISIVHLLRWEAQVQPIQILAIQHQEDSLRWLPEIQNPDWRCDHLPSEVSTILWRSGRNVLSHVHCTVRGTT